MVQRYARVSLIIGLALLLAAPTAFATNLTNVRVPPQHEIKLKLNDPNATVNGTPVTLQTPPQLINNTTMVPIRFIAESLGAEVRWHEQSKNITLTSSSVTISLKIDQPEAVINGMTVVLEQSATILNDNALIPLRFICESFNQVVTYDDQTHAITIIAEKSYPTASPADGKAASVPVRKKLEQPTVDNLTEGNLELFSRQPLNRTVFYDIIADKDNNIYILDFQENRTSLSKYLVSVYKPNEGKNLESFVRPNEKFNFSYTDKNNNAIIKYYDEFVPQRLFYDEQLDKIYLLASGKPQGLNRNDISLVFYEIKPDIKLITYLTEDTLNEEFNFFAGLGTNQFYYSNTFLNRVFSFSPGREVRTNVIPEGSRMSSFTAGIHNGQLYLLDKHNKRICLIKQDGSIKEVSKINLEHINEVVSKNGIFYIQDNKGFYLADINGKVEDYIKIDQLKYNRGIFNPKSNSYDDYGPTYTWVRLEGTSVVEYSQNPYEPSTINLVTSTKFTVDNQGNIILYDSNYQALRRINIYEK